MLRRRSGLMDEQFALLKRLLAPDEADRWSPWHTHRQGLNGHSILTCAAPVPKGGTHGAITGGAEWAVLEAVVGGTIASHP
ncbi:MAG: hypothetical protein D6823_03945 [Chloroflexi bacterium]|jgi:hypothetical protein|nr:MAG: hypothetical protein D6823_03945 [Chloroflexota bacterium]